MTEREQFDAFYATTSPLESTEATAFACWCAARRADEALMREAMTWFESHGECVFAGCGMGAIDAMNAIHGRMRARLEKEGTT